jgi:hypothetical protein
LENHVISNPVRILTSVALAALIVGCKLNVIVPPGGTVALGEGSPSECPEASVCEIDVSEADFSEAFTAIPNPGYKFVRWQGGKGFQCGDSTNNECVVKFNGSDFYIALTATRRTGYVMPVFKDVGVDTDDDGQKDFKDLDDDNDGINDTEEDGRCTLNADPVCGTGDAIVEDNLVPVRAAGKEWAQVDLFLGLSWNDISAVCPIGICKDGGKLNGHDMTGWTWARASGVNELFNCYGVTPAHSGPSRRELAGGDTWSTNFFRAGWRRTFSATFLFYTNGVTAIRIDSNTAYRAFMAWQDDYGDISDTSMVVQRAYGNPNKGAWFFRPI